MQYAITAAVRKAALVVACLAGVAGCAASRVTLADHPLAGKVWDVAAARFVAPAEAERRIAAADIALLGETHDNPEHHAVQLRLLRRTVDAGRKPALVMEQIDTEWQDAVDAARAVDGVDSAAIAAAGKVSPGWHWREYAELVTLALERRLKVVAANLSRARTRPIAAEGLAALGAGEPERLGLEPGWPAARRAAMRRVLVDGHCGDDSPIIDKLIDVQRARDAVMADTILKAGNDGVVAIIGRGHARADLGVPLYLAGRTGGRSVVSLGLVEVEQGRSAPTDYAETTPGTHDFVWFTPRAERADQCATFKRSAGKG